MADNTALPASADALVAPGLDPALVPLIHSLKLKTACAVLNRSRASLYELIGLGRLDAVKNGTNTEITVESIRRYQANMPRANIKAPTPKTRAARKRRKAGAR